jgi:branched-chain amino acid transport system permease protein
MNTSKTVEILVIAYVGGRKSLWGGVLIAFPFVYAMEMIRSSLAGLPGLSLIIYGLFLVLIMIYYPGGLAEFYQVYLGQSRSPLVRWLLNK